jgi:CheY-like chemotaxis protein
MPKTVLLVDDQELVSRVVQAALKPLGLRLPSVRTGAEALALIASPEPPDAVVLDYSMPDMDGVETLRRIRELPAGAAIPVLMLTVRDQTAIREAAGGLRVFDFMTKPFSPSVLQQTVRRMLEGGAAAA